jgi:hypothetical protein
MAIGRIEIWHGNITTSNSGFGAAIGGGACSRIADLTILNANITAVRPLLQPLGVGRETPVLLRLLIVLQ